MRAFDSALSGDPNHLGARLPVRAIGRGTRNVLTPYGRDDHPTRCEDWPALRLENGAVGLTVVPALGGKIVAVLEDLPPRRSWPLVEPPPSLENAPAGSLLHAGVRRRRLG